MKKENFMKFSLLVTTLILGASAAQASSLVLAECRGSVVKGTVGEIYTIEQNTVGKKSEIVVKSQYDNGYSITIPVSGGTVKINSVQTLQANAQQGFGFNYEKKSLTIDFVSGNGVASTYEPMDMLTKKRTIYLTYCTR
jgi:LEA14-like dessication related protein